jgi:RNA polymerase sigma factor (sigma-70 family)
MNIEELVRSTKAGDPSAGPFLISLFGPQLLRYAYVLAPELSEVDREIICENAVERAVCKIDAYEPARGPFSAWLRAFVRHEIGTWRRRHGRLVLDPEAAAPVAEPVTNPQYAEAAERVVSLFKELGETDQLMIALRDLEGLPYAEISRRLGASEVACRQRHLRALGKLRRLVDKDEHFAAIMRRGR